MTISTDLAILNNISSSQVPKYFLNWQILVAMFNEFYNIPRALLLNGSPVSALVLKSNRSGLLMV